MWQGKYCTGGCSSWVVIFCQVFFVHQNLKNLWQPHNLYKKLSYRRETARQRACLSKHALYFRKLESLGYIFDADGSSFIRLAVVASQKCELQN